MKLKTISTEDHIAFADAIESGDGDQIRSLLQSFPELLAHPDWVPPPIHCAVLWKQPSSVQVLLDSGADIESQEPDRKTTPLRYAVMYCQLESIQLLLSRGANAGAVVDGGTTALQLAQEAADGAYEEFEDLPARENLDSLPKCRVMPQRIRNFAARLGESVVEVAKSSNWQKSSKCRNFRWE